jgi:putative nucleotidyltransferase with HDIG domain
MPGIPLAENKKGPDYPESYAPYAGRWVATLQGRVIGQGGTPKQALQSAMASRYKEIPIVRYIPGSSPLKFSPLLYKVQSILENIPEIYLVGGAVRDALLNHVSHDLDFVLEKGALKAARRVANELKGAYYRLDDEHGTGRVVLVEDNGTRNIMDFAIMRGENLESDLIKRDFTINAMAVHLQQPTQILDPTSGASDLVNGVLRTCSKNSFRDDPLRIIRAVRFASNLKLRIESETLTTLRQSVDDLSKISPERKRNELLYILDSPQPAVSIRTLDILKVLPHLLPELLALKDVEQPPPHVSDVWEHTLLCLLKLEMILNALNEKYDESFASEFTMGTIVLRLGRYRSQITRHINTTITPDRSRRALLYLAALYHDIAKPETLERDIDGRIRFINHENLGAEIISVRASKFHMSNAERDHLKRIVRNHLRPLQLAMIGKSPSRRAVYRFFRDTRSAGVDIVLLSLADLLATYGPTYPPETLDRQLGISRTLFEAWWDQPEESISPPSLINGNDIINTFELKPGPLIGQLLDLVREEQADGEIQTRREALAYVRRLLNED